MVLSNEEIYTIFQVVGGQFNHIERILTLHSLGYSLESKYYQTIHIEDKIDIINNFFPYIILSYLRSSIDAIAIVKEIPKFRIYDALFHGVPCDSKRCPGELLQKAMERLVEANFYSTPLPETNPEKNTNSNSNPTSDSTSSSALSVISTSNELVPAIPETIPAQNSDHSGDNSNGNIGEDSSQHQHAKGEKKEKKKEKEVSFIGIWSGVLFVDMMENLFKGENNTCLRCFVKEQVFILILIREIYISSYLFISLTNLSIYRSFLLRFWMFIWTLAVNHRFQ